MSEFILINNDSYKLYVEYDCEDIDYYTQVKMFVQCNEKSFLIAKDNILFFYNLFNSYIENINNYILNKKLEPDCLGKQLNEYYYQVRSNQVYQDIILNESGHWIGEKYCCFEYNGYAMWIYKYNDRIYLLLTELYDGFFGENSLDSFKSFIKNYKNKILRVEITVNELYCLKNYFELLCGKYIYIDKKL